VIRHFLTLLTWIILLPSANAMIAPHRDASPWRVKSYHAVVEPIPVLAQDRPYQITERTEVLLDGRKCKYREVPSSAEIIEMEIDSDVGRGILRVHFQSCK